MNKFLSLFRTGGNGGGVSGKHPQGGLGRFALQIGTVAAVACVLLLAVRIVLAGPTYAGPISVTANMGNFSPSLVKVNSSATSGLSAYYTPPSGTPEGQLSASYDWSVSSVQFKGTQAGTFGSPPTNSYTDSISPSQPSASSGATLTFTPKIAGYWAVSTSCSVTVTDTTTNQYWSGSGNAGPEDLTSVDATITPKNGSTVFVNTEYFVHVTYAPSDLNANLAISGGMTFANGVTSEAMAAASEDVYFYGPNVYSSGSASSGDITVTVSPPASGSPAINGTEAASSAAGSGGGSVSFKVPVDSFDFSATWVAGLKYITSALVQSGVNLIMPNLETNTNNYLQGLADDGGPQGTAAQDEYNYLNNPPNSGYNALAGSLTTFLNDVATGSSNASVPPQIEVLDAPSGPTLKMPGFPASAVKNITLTPSMTVSFNYPYISPSGQWQPPKLGDLLANFGISGTAPISDDTLVPISGNWTGSLAAALSAGHNFQLQDGTYSASIGFDVDLFNNKNVQLEMQATGTYSPAGGSVRNDLTGQVVAGFAVSW